MRFDPVHRGQLLARRAGELLRNPDEQTRRVETFDDAELAAAYERGQQAFEVLAERIERLTGCELATRRALDFGCGVGRLALPLAQRARHVHGLDISAEVLREADLNAKRMGLTNVEWSDAGRLAELAGTYDLVISMFVFQHIPSREGEHILSTIVAGLAPGGVGAIHLMLRPGRRLPGSKPGAASDAHGAKRAGDVLRRLDWGYPYTLVHSYSLNRIARLLAEQDISEWHVRRQETVGRRAYDTATVFFSKP